MRPSEEFTYRGPAHLIVRDGDGDERAVEVAAVRAHGDTLLAAIGDSVINIPFRTAEVRCLSVRNAKRGAWQGMAMGLAAGTATGFAWGYLLERDEPEEFCEADGSGQFFTCRKTYKGLWLYGGTLVGSLGGMAAGALAGAWLGAKTEFVFKGTLVAHGDGPLNKDR